MKAVRLFSGNRMESSVAKDCWGLYASFYILNVFSNTSLLRGADGTKECCIISRPMMLL